MSIARAGLLSVALLLGSIVVGTGSTGAVVPGANGRIVYVGYDYESGDSDIYSMNPDGTDVTRITTDGQSKSGPAWSPDGTKISFGSSAISDAGSCCSLNLYVMNADGSDRQRLTDTLDTMVGSNTGATWSPDGTWLAFVSDRGDTGGFAGDRELYRMNADGSDQTQLTATDARTTDEEPSISSVSERIAFASNRGDTTYGTFDIYTMNADGSDVDRLTADGSYAYPIAFESRQPVWSPDGSRIAFESTRNGNYDIWVMDADGGNPVNISNHPSLDTDPAWSPDGTQILFTSLRDGQYDVWAVDAPTAQLTAGRFIPSALQVMTVSAASAPRNLTGGTDLDVSSPNWQPLVAADTTKPTITISSPTASTYLLKQSVVADYACQDEDGVSGIASCTGKAADGRRIGTNTVGAKTFWVHATDGAGNLRRRQVSYTVAYGICTAFDQEREYRSWRILSISIQLCDVNGANVSVASVPVRVTVLTPGPLPDGAKPTFRFATDGSVGSYVYRLALADLPAGEHVLSFTAGADPTVHTLRVRVARGGSTTPLMTGFE